LCNPLRICKMMSSFEPEGVLPIEVANAFTSLRFELFKISRSLSSVISLQSNSNSPLLLFTFLCSVFSSKGLFLVSMPMKGDQERRLGLISKAGTDRPGNPRNIIANSTVFQNWSPLTRSASSTSNSWGSSKLVRGQSNATFCSGP